MTTRRVRRYRLPITDHAVVTMPADATLLAVGSSRDGTDRLDLWADVDPTTEDQQRRLFIVGSGQRPPARRGPYVGTAATHNGALLWHVFEEAPTAVHDRQTAAALPHERTESDCNGS